MNPADYYFKMGHEYLTTTPFMEASVQGMCNKIKFKTVTEILDKMEEAIRALRILEKFKWPGGRPICPRCGRKRDIRIRRKAIQLFRCPSCKTEFTVRTGTIMERSHVPPVKWVRAIYLMFSYPTGISIRYLADKKEVSYPTAWLMVQKINYVCKTQGDIFGLIFFKELDKPKDEKKRKFQGIIEGDCAYFGGLEKNKHADKKRGWGRGLTGNLPVLGLRGRASKRSIRLVLPDTSQQTVEKAVCQYVEKGSTVITDEHRAYLGLRRLGNNHLWVNHSQKQYVKGEKHTNGVESMWSRAKLEFSMVHSWFCRKHAPGYLAALAYRMNVWSKPKSVIPKIDKIGDFLFRMLMTGPHRYKQMVA